MAGKRKTAWNVAVVFGLGMGVAACCPQRGAAVLAKEGEIASRGNIVYQDSRGTAAVYSADFIRLREKLASIPEEVFSPAAGGNGCPLELAAFAQPVLKAVGEKEKVVVSETAAREEAATQESAEAEAATQESVEEETGAQESAEDKTGAQESDEEEAGAQESVEEEAGAQESDKEETGTSGSAEEEAGASESVSENNCEAQKAVDETAAGAQEEMDETTAETREAVDGTAAEAQEKIEEGENG